jgi:hypothetical protein
VTGSPSPSAFVAVAVSVWFVVGEAGESETVAVGSSPATVTGADVTGAEFPVPSLAVTRARTRSPSSPFPAVPRFSVEPVAPEMSAPFFVHW